MIRPGSFVNGDGIPACSSPVTQGETDKYLGWHLEPDEVALCLFIVVADEPTDLPVDSRRWALCLARGGLGWFYVPALEVQTDPPAC